MNLEKQMLAYLFEQCQYIEKQRILLAVSGGMDSVLLAHLFKACQLPFGIAHCNFGLRGEESDADELFVRKLAQQLKVPIHVQYFDTEKFANDHHLSIQQAARSLRYQWFFQTMETDGYYLVATAHHASDAIETLLYNLSKGTGIAGLHGILPRNGQIIRPLLFAEREQMHEYVAEKQLTWREDSSNQSSKYARNLIRQEVMPVLKRINPNLEHTAKRSFERIRAVEALVQASLESFLAQHSEKKGKEWYLSTEAFEQHPQGTELLAEALQPYGFGYQQAKEIVESSQKQSGLTFESPLYQVLKDRKHWIVSSRQNISYQAFVIDKNTSVLEHPEYKIELSILSREALGSIPSAKNIACLDADTVSFPFMLRRWKEGDWLIPLGMKGKKKVSDYLIDEKVPLTEKERIFVLQSGKSICWIVGHRIDHRFALTPNTKQVLLIKAIKK